MPRYIAEQLDLTSQIKYTPVKLQLADRSLVKPQRIIEDVCVGVGKFVLPCDFMVMDVETNIDTPLIIGRPFLATGDAWIGVKDKIVVLQVSGEKLVLNLDKAIQYPAEPVQNQQIDQIAQCVECMLEELMNVKEESTDVDRENQEAVCELKAISELKQNDGETEIQVG